MAFWLVATAAWFAVSVGTEVLSSFVLYVWLLRHGEKPRWVSYGFPGYLEGLYQEHCERAGRSWRVVVLFRRSVFMNLIASTAALLLYLGVHD